MIEELNGKAGVLPSQWLKAAVKEKVIEAGGYTIPDENVQPASLDLRLGETAHRIRCSFLPAKDSVERAVKDFIVDSFSLHNEGVVLETGRPYLIELKERLNLPNFMRARANPKSSTGRADVFTRVITDRSNRFDDISAGYQGGLYLEVVPLSFPVRVREDMSLNQLRLSLGRPQLSDEQLRSMQREQPILFRGGEPVPDDQMPLADGLFLSLDLRGDPSRHVGYRARANAPLLDLTKVGATDPSAYWERVYPDDGRRIILDPKSFYLLMSREAVRVPPTVAAEMAAYDPTSGELRTHYAGFFDPGFGFDRDNHFQGSTAALEVRAHDVPFMVEDGQLVCKLTFESMLEEPETLYGEGAGSNYQQQTETLGKHFRREQPRAVTRGSKPPVQQRNVLAEPMFDLPREDN